MRRSSQELPPWSFAPMGDRGLLLTWCGPKAKAAAALRAAARALAHLTMRSVPEIVPGIDSLLVCYDPLSDAPRELRRRIEAILPRPAGDEGEPGRLVEIAVSYGGAEGPDLAYVARACNLSEAQVIARHAARAMPVLMLGFMPGFPYIGLLPVELRLPRRAEPRVAVAAGSVAIANDQTGIYPSQSPGGWHIIGRTATVLFDPLRDPPATLRAGDYVRFVPLAVDD